MPAHAATPAAEIPQRIAMLYMPNGVRPDRWTPEGDGSRFKLSPILKSLEAYREEILICTGLQNKASFHVPILREVLADGLRDVQGL